MSTDQSEEGVIKLTKNGYSQVLRKVKSVHARWQDMRYDFSCALHAKLEKLPKSERNFYSVIDMVPRKEIGGGQLGRVSLPGHKEDYGGLFMTDEDLVDCISEVLRGKGGALCKPRRSAFPKAKSTDKNFEFNYGDCSITMRGGDHPTLDWDVSENNRASDWAWSHPITEAIMSNFLKNEYTWKRGEGGNIHCYSDSHDGEGVEYSHDIALGNASLQKKSKHGSGSSYPMSSRFGM